MINKIGTRREYVLTLHNNSFIGKIFPFPKFKNPPIPVGYMAAKEHGQPYNCNIYLNINKY